jgi:diguanylate cyclase (GGDEF)-like protein/PAS domain S-box-containing protein
LKVEQHDLDCVASQYDTGEQRFLELISALPKVSVQGYDVNRNVIYWNKSSEDIYGFTSQEALGAKLEDLIIPDEMKDTVIALHHQWVTNGIPIPSEQLPLKRKDGSTVHVFSSHVMLRENTDFPEMFCIDVDLSKEVCALKELERMASTDLLTGLPNRRYLYSELDETIRQTTKGNTGFALLFIDLDMFKEVNDTLGHTWGDKLLCAATARLRECLSEDEVIVRFGGDEFVVLLKNVRDEEHISVIAKRLVGCFERSFDLDGESIRVTMSVGISRFPKDGLKPDDLLKNADVAMYQAKAEGRNQFQFFDVVLSERVATQRAIASQLYESLEKGEFELVYQPQFDLKSKRIAACEALLRWCPADESKTVPPNVFIPIAERTDLIIKIGHWVLNQACEQIVKWKACGINIRVDINISGKELVQPRFFEHLASVKKRFGLTPIDLGIELTENVLIDSSSDVLKGLRALRDSGVEISIDDFGVGYSSLGYLRQFPISHLKIDRSFLKHAPQDTYDGALLEAIINVGHQLNLKIVAEGVETREQSEYCKARDVEYAQGYLFSKPLSVNDIEMLLKKRCEMG